MTDKITDTHAFVSNFLDGIRQRDLRIERLTARVAELESPWRPISGAPRDGTPIVGAETYRYQQPYKWDNDAPPAVWMPADALPPAPETEDCVMGDDWTNYETTRTPTRPPGGQQAGSDPGRITVTHIPTGTSASVSCRSQHRANELARMMVDFALESGWMLMTNPPEPCLSGQCRSPLACNGWGYCRERNADDGGYVSAAVALERRAAVDRQRRIGDPEFRDGMPPDPNA